MAITQISRITHRKGLNENLPQLAGAELGWALDERKLYIGNGTTAEGAPTVGNTEILTEYSNILEVGQTYTYKGAEAGYTVVTGVDANNPITRSLQEKFDDFASVRDFGATGDGSTDDTAAINRALDQLFVQETNPLVRRSLFFPAGVYKVTGTIKIPAYARLFGEGSNSSIIKYYTDVSTDTYVARTSDSKNQTGASITNNSATVPTGIEMQSMSIETTEDNHILLIESAVDCSFEDMLFKGPKTTSSITASDDKACIIVLGTSILYPKNINFNRVTTEGTGYGFYANDKCRGITLSNSRIHTHYKGVRLGETPENNGPTGVRIQQCVFDDIHSQGIQIGAVSYNISAYNIFYDVGNTFNGSGSPSSTIIDIANADNVSIGDLFERDDTDNASYQRIFLTEKASIGMDGAQGLQLGTHSYGVGQVATLTDNTSSATTIFTIDLTNTHTNVDIACFRMNYSLIRNGNHRMGSIDIASDGSASVTYSEDYTENTTTGITFSVTQSSDDVSVKYTTTSTGQNATLSYSIEKLY